VAQGDAGQAFLDTLAALTGADVAASTDTTGLGGDWVLEASRGVIETTALDIPSYLGRLDTLSGTSGNDSLEGSVVNDALSGLAGYDTLRGYGGDDTLEGGNDGDQLYGGQGNDLLIGGTAGTNADTNYNNLYGEDGNDTLIGGNYLGYGDYLYGGAGDDLLQGNDGDDRLYGDTGNDSLEGGAGNDYIDYNAGQDTLLGGAGNDLFSLSNSSTTGSALITGGAGQDRYVLYGNTTSAALTVTDFEAGTGGDVIDINSLLTNSPGYSSGNPFDAGLGYLRLVQAGADARLEWDKDGASGGSYTWHTVLTLQNLDLGTTPLVATNFSPNTAAPTLNLDPQFSQLDGAPTFTEGGAAVILDCDVSVSDAELTSQGHFDGASLTLARQGGASADDLFSASGDLSFAGGVLSVGGVAIGTVSNAGGTLTLYFDSNATQARVDAALRQIAYANVSDAPPATVQIAWAFNDGNPTNLSNGDQTVISSMTVNLIGTNDAPVAVADDNTMTEDQMTVTGNVLANDTDIDGDALTVDSAPVSLSVAEGTLVIQGDGDYVFTLSSAGVSAAQALDDGADGKSVV
jgi:hypothetical protein